MIDINSRTDKKEDPDKKTEKERHSPSFFLFLTRLTLMLWGSGGAGRTTRLLTTRFTL